MRDHGGNIDEAIATFGGNAARWIDLSTGINRQPYPAPSLEPVAWTDLPTRTAREHLICEAARAYRTQAAVLPVAGAQAATNRASPRPSRARRVGRPAAETSKNIR